MRVFLLTVAVAFLGVLTETTESRLTTRSDIHPIEDFRAETKRSLRTHDTDDALASSDEERAPVTTNLKLIDDVANVKLADDVANVKLADDALGGFTEDDLQILHRSLSDWARQEKTVDDVANMMRAEYGNSAALIEWMPKLYKWYLGFRAKTLANRAGTSTTTK